MRLDARARQDVAILGSEFLKLDGKLLHQWHFDLMWFKYLQVYWNDNLSSPKIFDSKANFEL